MLELSLSGVPTERAKESACIFLIILCRTEAIHVLVTRGAEAFDGQPISRTTF